MSADAASVLIVDDDADVGHSLLLLLKQAAHAPRLVASAEAALVELEKRPFDLVLSDVRMPGLSGLELLKLVKAKTPDMPVILLTAHASVSMAVEAMREGAADFLEKPFQRDELLLVVRKALAASAADRSAPPRPLRAKEETTDGMVGSSPALDEAREHIRKAAKGNSTVVILGESGTGKELAARALHTLSERKKKPFVAVNCGAIPVDLIESELFGHEAGAFTGAVRRKPGRVELAEGGTLFLDEIGDLPLSAQSRLLRFLQEKTFDLVGGTETRTADVRVIAATHRGLSEMVKAKTFRDDLYYRLAVPISMPALRDRPGDIEPLVKHFLSVLGPQNGRPKASVTEGAMALLKAQHWDGNVRQLQTVIEGLTVLGPDGDVFDEKAVQAELDRRGLGKPRAAAGPSAESLPERRKDAEREAVEEALKRVAGNRSKAARLLGVSRRTLYNKLEALGLTEA